MPNKRLLIITCCLALSACVSPAAHFAAVADEFGFYGFVMHGDAFEHQLYANAAARQPAARQSLHVYLDGDGTPWIREQWLAEDPTARDPLILKLMQQDPAPAIFLGRPCYHGLQASTGCHHRYWTSHRYAETVVRSLTTVLRAYLQQQPAQQVVLIGYSGGGTLAALLARDLPQTRALVTVAANLDVAAWSALRGYPQLTDSLNPAHHPALPAHIKQIHLAGLQDQAVAAQIVQNYAQTQAAAIYLAFPHYDHHCCWVETWRNILALL